MFMGYMFNSVGSSNYYNLPKQAQGFVCRNPYDSIVEGSTNMLLSHGVHNVFLKLDAFKSYSAVPDLATAD